MSLSVKPSGFCSARTMAAVSAAVLLSIGLLITGLVTAASRDERARSMLAQHLELTVTSSKYMINVYISFVAAAFSARQIVQEQYALWNSPAALENSTATAAPLASILAALSATFPQTALTFAATAVIREAERPVFEALLNRTCAGPLGSSNISLGNVLVRAPRAEIPRLPAAASGLYSIVVDAIVMGATSKAPACSLIGLEFSRSDFRTQRFLEAIDSGRLIWQVPTPALGSPVGQLNIGLLMPILAPTAAAAGPVGAAHAAYLATRSDTVPLIPWTCARDGSDSASTPCGQAGRALGTITIPMYATTPLSTLVDNVPNAKGSQLTLLYVPPESKHLLRLDGRDVLRGEPVRLTALNTTPLSDDSYTEETYMQRTSWLLDRGSLQPLLAAIPKSSFLLSALYDPDAAARITAGQQSGQAFGPWMAMSNADTVSDSIVQADIDVAKLQAARVFLLGSSAYVFILRDRAGVDTPEFVASQALAWTVGVLLSILLATLPPGLAYGFALQQERQHAVQMALLQSEKDGVVQAVAFAAHEIRNPMHGVLASLETALADLQPLVTELKRKKHAKSSTAAREPAPGDDDSGRRESVLSTELVRLLGPRGTETAVLALEDIAVAKYSAENCHRLVNDMVEYSKLQRGVMSIQKGDMEVRPALRALVDSQRSFLHPSVRTFVGAHADVPVMFHTDQVRVTQILANGLTNASKFTIAGEVYLSCLLLDVSSIPALHTRSNPSNKWAAFLVADTGKGLAGIDVDTLFEPIKVAAHVEKRSHPLRDFQRRVRKWLGKGKGGQTADKEPHSAGNGNSTGKGVQEQAVTVTIGPASPRSKMPGSGQPASQVGGKAGGTKSLPTNQPMTASSVAKLRGSGLGLPVARLMARALGGDVDLYTETDSGLGKSLTVFMFILPESAMQEAALEPVQRPLFGRAGTLNAVARQELRALVCKRMNSLLPGAAAVQQFEELSAHSGSDSFPPVAASAQSKSSQSGSSDKRSGIATSSQGTGSTRRLVGAGTAPTVDIPAGIVVPMDPVAARDSNAPPSSVFEETAPRRRVGFPTEQTVSTDSRSSLELAAAPAPVTALTDPLRMSSSHRVHSGHSQHSAHSPLAVQAGPPRLHAAGTSRTETGSVVQTISSSSAAGAGGAEVDAASIKIRVSREDKGGQRGDSRLHTVDEDSTDMPEARDLPNAAAWPRASHLPPSLAVVRTERPKGAPIQLLYAEDDGTNRRLMERMLGRLGSGHHKAVTGVGSPASGQDSQSSGSSGSPQQSPVLKTEIMTVGDGWEALCTLHRHGHIDAGTLARAQTAAASAEGELTLPYAADLHGDGEVPVVPFDIIFLDVDMPRASGDQVAAYLRQTQALADARALDVPIIAVTGRAVELQIKSTLIQRLGCATLPQGSGVRVLDKLPDPVLDAVFDGALGKPFKGSHLQTLMELLQPKH